MIKSNRLKKIKRQLLGYRMLINNGRLGYIRDIRIKLVETPIIKKQISKWPLLSRSPSVTLEIALRQFFSSFSLGDNSNLLNNIIEIHNTEKKIRTYIPPEWQSLLIREGLQVARLDCTARWYLYCTYRLMRNIYKDSLYFFLLMFRKHKPILKNVNTFFFDINSNNIPNQRNDGIATKTIIDWYILNEIGKSSEGNQVFVHNINIEDFTVGAIQLKYSNLPWLLISGYRKRLIFFGKWLFMVINAAVNLFFCRWEHALLLSEQTRAIAIDFVDNKHLAKLFYIPFFASPYKPLWAYKVEKRGSKVELYFPSSFLHPTSAEKNDYDLWHLKTATWSTINVWNSLMSESLHQHFSEKHSKAPNIKVTGPIWFSDDSKVSSPEYNSRRIAVFPVDQVRPSRYLGISTTAEWVYRYPDIYTKFGEDILKVLEENRFLVAWKEKRKGVVGWNKKSSTLFRKRLQTRASCNFVSSNLSAMRLIESCRASISFPFTSTALLAQSEGRLAVYYDPTGWISSHDPASNGVLTLVGIDSLRSWVRDIL
jgi:polysaccharide biosynthesis PFTS motif protein